MQSTAALDGLSADSLINSTEARRLAGGISVMTLWRWERDGIIPEPRRIRSRNYWKYAEFIAALDAAAKAEREPA